MIPSEWRDEDGHPILPQLKQPSLWRLIVSTPAPPDGAPNAPIPPSTMRYLMANARIGALRALKANGNTKAGHLLASLAKRLKKIA